MLSFEGRSSGSHYVESWLWKRLWTCRKTYIYIFFRKGQYCSTDWIVLLLLPFFAITLWSWTWQQQHELLRDEMMVRFSPLYWSLACTYAALTAQSIILSVCLSACLPYTSIYLPKRPSIAQVRHSHHTLRPSINLSNGIASKWRNEFLEMIDAGILTLQSRVVTICTTCISFKKVCILITQSVYISPNNSDKLLLFSQQALTGGYL